MAKDDKPIKKNNKGGRMKMLKKIYPEIIGNAIMLSALMLLGAGLIFGFDSVLLYEGYTFESETEWGQVLENWPVFLSHVVYVYAFFIAWGLFCFYPHFKDMVVETIKKKEAK